MSRILDFFEWYEINHMARIAKELDLLTARERFILFNYFGKPKLYLAKGHEEYYRPFEDWQYNQFDDIFIKFMKNFIKGYHCEKKSWCSTCHKLNLIKEYIEKEGFLEKISTKYVEQKEKWELELKLYDWQEECICEWEKRGKGIVKVVTGAGKTILALEAISRIKEKYKDVIVFIIVPTIALLEQWEDTIKEKMNIRSKDVGLFYTSEWGNHLKCPVQIYVINSARDYLPEYNDNLRELGYKTFLIADECHRYGSQENSKIFETLYDFYLGLSALPEREGDYAFEEVLVPNLGEIIFEYSYKDALRDGIIPPFTLINYKISLKEKEEENYNELTESIKKLQNTLRKRYPSLRYTDDDDFFKQLNFLQQQEEDTDIEMYKLLLFKRRMLVHDAENRYQALEEILEEIYQEIDSPRIIIFHEKIECADKIYNKLCNKYAVGIYHSQINKSDRKDALYDYKHGLSEILVTCKALDEGLDVPDTNVGIIVSATKSVRQRIQRIGRILRKAENKDHSYIYTIYIPEIDDDVFYKEDIKKLEGVAEIIYRSLDN